MTFVVKLSNGEMWEVEADRLFVTDDLTLQFYSGKRRRFNPPKASIPRGCWLAVGPVYR